MEKLKKSIIIMCFPIAALMLTLSVLLTLPFANNTNQKSIDTTYILKDYGGYPALFCSDEALPIRTYPTIYTHLLPQADAVSLQDGIIITSEDQLRSLIEDFDG